MEYILYKLKNSFVVMSLATCFIVSVITLIIYFTVDVHQYSKHYGVRKNEQIMFKTILDDGIQYFNATWVSDNEILSHDDDGNIILYNVNKSIQSILAFNSMRHIKYCKSYELSADKKYLLIGYNTNVNFSSYVTMGNYDVINIKTGKQVTLTDAQRRPRDIMKAIWSPTNSSLAIVDDYNIFYIPSAVQPNLAKQITFNGSKDLYYGIPDWVYEEELLAYKSQCGMWFSAQGTKLAYAAFNETLVPTVSMQHYGIPETMYDQYSQAYDYHYPKVDDPNPTVELFVQNLNNAVDVPIAIKPVKNYNNETILDNVIWSGDEHLFVMWMNRLQNESHLVHYHITNNTANVKERVAVIYPQKQVDGDTYGHVNVLEENGEMKSVTDGKFEVLKIMKWDADTNYIYYLASVEDRPERQQLYRVLVDLERHIRHEPECLSCDGMCTYSTATLSEKNTYFAHTCEGPNIPYVNIMKTNGEHISTWESNKNIYRLLQNVILPRVVFLSIPLVDKFEARVKLLIPPTFDVSSGKKYPVLIDSYGGPMFNTVIDTFDIDMGTYLSVNHDFIVVQIDGRGTERKGFNTLFENYKKLGSGEVDDSIIVAKYLQSFSYVDSDRIAIYGWSYGGYVAGMALARDNENIFKCAVSVAPVTDWIYYDSFYTERLMGSYKKNVEGYHNASLIENASGLRNKNFFLIHGLLDSNVHFQHSAMLSKELQHLDIQFKQQFYPDESHTLSNVKNHVYHTIIAYLLDCLK